MLDLRRAEGSEDEEEYAEGDDEDDEGFQQALEVFVQSFDISTFCELIEDKVSVPDESIVSTMGTMSETRKEA